MLSYTNNKGTDYFWRRFNRIGFADENYAREVMQLFSIGLVKLNNDGTLKLDQDGNPIPTYTNDEIVEYARVWTGFKQPGKRGNIEMRFSGNNIDPMLLDALWRDSLPKLGLDGFYIGDGLPLCSDLPERHFLRKGATYILLGSDSTARYHSETSNWSTKAGTVRTKLDESNSALYATLCNQDGQSGGCRYSPKVVLKEHLDCFGEECEITAPRIVEVGLGIFYEYVRLPCALQPFFSDGHAVATRLPGSFWTYYACEDSRTEAVGLGCCSLQGGRNILSPIFGHFHGERLPWQTAEQLCKESGLEVCPGSHARCQECDWHQNYWLDLGCSQQVKISLDGRVGIVHSFQGFDTMATYPAVKEDTKTFFRVVWSTSGSDWDMDSLLSDYDKMCSLLGCPRDSVDNLCLCSAKVVESMAFEDAPSRQQVLEELFIGAFDPDPLLHSVSPLGDGVKMHSMDGLYTSESVFEVVDDYGITQFRRNLRSDVILGGDSPGSLQASFRNPLHHASIHSADPRDQLYETDATLDHYFVSSCSS